MSICREGWKRAEPNATTIRQTGGKSRPLLSLFEQFCAVLFSKAKHHGRCHQAIVLPRSLTAKKSPGSGFRASRGTFSNRCMLPNKYRTLCQDQALLLLPIRVSLLALAFPLPAPVVVAVAPVSTSPAPKLCPVHYAALAVLEHAFVSIRATSINPQRLHAAAIRVHIKGAIAHSKLAVRSGQFLQPVGHIDVAALGSVLSR